MENTANKKIGIINRTVPFIFIGEKVPKDDELSVDVNSNEGILISGLIALGLLVPGATTFDEVGQFHFSPLVEKVLKIIGASRG